jgi:hypothetical protein
MDCPDAVGVGFFYPVFHDLLFGSGFAQKFRITKHSWDEEEGRWSDLISMVIVNEEWDTQRGVKATHRVEA